MHQHILEQTRFQINTGALSYQRNRVGARISGQWTAAHDERFAKRTCILGTAETGNAGDPVQLVANPEVIHSGV
jgi:hypothetical protein